MRSTYNVTNDIFKNYVTKTTVQSSYHSYDYDMIYDMMLQNKQVVTSDEASQFSNQEELDEFIDHQALMQYHDFFFGGEKCVILGIKDIYDFKKRVRDTALKTGNIFKILDVVDEFCDKMANTIHDL